MLTFDEETAHRLERAYHGRDFAERRAANLAALAPRPGDHVVDIGCGNGMLTPDVAARVGPEGRVTGVDPSPDMRALAEARVAGLAQVRIADGTAEALPVADGAADGAVAIQVLEYVADLRAAVDEVRRVLRAGGRFVAGDMHFDAFAWFSEAPERMRRMMAAWDGHLVHRDAPARLVAALGWAGFDVERVEAFPCIDTELRADGLARMMMILMRDYATRTGAMDAVEADEWYAEQELLAEEGRFFFCLTHVVVTARRH